MLIATDDMTCQILISVSILSRLPWGSQYKKSWYLYYQYRIWSRNRQGDAVGHRAVDSETYLPAWGRRRLPFCNAHRMGFQRGLAPFGGVQRQSLWQVRAAPGGASGKAFPVQRTHASITRISSPSGDSMRYFPAASGTMHVSA